jgi:hypothetical protein
MVVAQIQHEAPANSGATPCWVGRVGLFVVAAVIEGSARSRSRTLRDQDASRRQAGPGQSCLECERLAGQCVEGVLESLAVERRRPVRGSLLRGFVRRSLVGTDTDWQARR